MNKRTPCEIDLYIGKKIKKMRKLQKVSQKEIEKKINVTFSQIHKYETGKNRISVSRLFLIAEMFNVDISYFTLGFKKATQPIKKDSL